MWFGGEVVLYTFRFRALRSAYLRRLSPIDRYQTLDLYMPGPGNPPGTYRRLREALWHQQDNPDLERLRREVWRRYRQCIIWMFGFPVFCIGVAALLIATGLVRPL